MQLVLPFASSRVAVEEMLDHAAGELVFAEKYLAGVFLFEERGLFFAVRRTTVSMRGLTVRAISIMRRTFSVSGVAITSTRARWICA